MNDYELEHECIEYAKENGVWRPKQHWRGVGLGESEQVFEFINDDGDRVTFTATGYMEDYIPGNYVDREPEYPEPVVFVRDIEVTPILKATEDELMKLGLTEYQDGAFGIGFGDGFRLDIEDGEVWLSHENKKVRLIIRNVDELKMFLKMAPILKSL